MAVRMFVEDYDAAPDGVGTYTKCDREFSSLKDALTHWRWRLHRVGWGVIKEVETGEILETLRDGE